MQPSLHIDPATGLLCGAAQLLSPHCDERPAGVVPELVVVHGISLPPGEFDGPWIAQLFCGCLRPGAHPCFETVSGLWVSAHFLVRRAGAVQQFVPCGLRAWHAGVSMWNGREACNDFSIGIELEGTDELPYAAAQYTSLIALVRALCAAYPTLAHERVVGHSDIAPGRKSDPGPAFDWNLLRSGLA